MHAQHAVEAGLAGQVDPLVGEHGHDARRGHAGKARLVGHAQHLCTLGWAECVGWCRALRIGCNAHLQRCATRRQQLRQRFVLDTLSVSSHLYPSLPPGYWFYRGDKESDTGGVQNKLLPLQASSPQGSICVSRSYKHAQKGVRESLAAAMVVMDKLEEPAVEREPFLGDATMGASPGALQ
jgi:hypothetical protein